MVGAMPMHNAAIAFLLIGIDRGALSDTKLR